MLKRRWMRVAIVFLVIPLLSATACILWMAFRANTSYFAPMLPLENWPAVSNGRHNSNTDLIRWQDQFYLIHASSRWHFASDDCRLILWKSPDARKWEKVREFAIPGEDIRDPKLAIIKDRLFLFVLGNRLRNPEPYGTLQCSSEDGATWTDLTPVEPAGWLFWRPKTQDTQTWYVPAYWNEHGKSILLASEDGEHWREIATIYEGDRNDETDFEFTPDGRIIATARLEFSEDLCGDPRACTAIVTARPPYTTWTHVKDYTTRLDGPCLFTYGGGIYAVGRHNPQSPRWPWYFGSIFGKKRTALYRVTQDHLEYLSDLPSAGDTAYAGTVIHDGSLFISYYTSNLRRDYPWILGMLLPSDIMIARTDLDALVRQPIQVPSLPQDH